MIEFISGKLLRKEPTHIIVDVNGIGYGIDVSLRTSGALPEPGETVSLWAYLHVKEDSQELFGFSSEAEREVFLKLISVSGIGPKIALRVLSEITPEELIRRVLEGNVLLLTKLKGIGKKTAEVMIATLRVPLSKLNLESAVRTAVLSEDEQNIRDAVKALLTLGVKDGAAQAAVEKAVQASAGVLPTSEIITEALKLL